MKLKEVLIEDSFFQEPKDPNIIYLNIKQPVMLEKFIEEIAKASYRKGAVDGLANTVTYESPDFFWKEYKDKII